MIISKYFNASVFECEYEVNSLAGLFLKPGPNTTPQPPILHFSPNPRRTDTIRTILKAVNDLMIGTYLANGRANPIPYTFIRQTTSGTEIMSNMGRGNSVQGGIGLFRSFYGLSDDAIIFQLFVPANMMFSRYLASCAGIMQSLEPAFAAEMSTLLPHFTLPSRPVAL